MQRKGGKEESKGREEGGKKQFTMEPHVIEVDPLHVIGYRDELTESPKRTDAHLVRSRMEISFAKSTASSMRIILQDKPVSAILCELAEEYFRAACCILPNDAEKEGEKEDEMLQQRQRWDDDDDDEEEKRHFYACSKLRSIVTAAVCTFAASKDLSIPLEAATVWQWFSTASPEHYIGVSQASSSPIGGQRKRTFWKVLQRFREDRGGGGGGGSENTAGEEIRSLASKIYSEHALCCFRPCRVSFADFGDVVRLANELQTFYPSRRETLIAVCLHVLFSLRRKQHLTAATNQNLFSPPCQQGDYFARHWFMDLDRCAGMMRVSSNNVARISRGFLRRLQQQEEEEENKGGEENEQRRKLRGRHLTAAEERDRLVKVLIKVSDRSHWKPLASGISGSKQHLLWRFHVGNLLLQQDHAKRDNIFQGCHQGLITQCGGDKEAD